MTRELKVFLVAPKQRGLSLSTRLGKHIVEVHNLVDRTVANNDHEASLVELDTVFNENSDPLIYLLFHSFIWMV